VSLHVLHNENDQNSTLGHHNIHQLTRTWSKGQRSYAISTIAYTSV